MQTGQGKNLYLLMPQVKVARSRAVPQDNAYDEWDPLVLIPPVSSVIIFQLIALCL